MPGVKVNFFYSSILTTANYLFPLLTFPYVTRVLGVTNIGTVNFVDSIINYFVLASMMGINIVGIREVAQHKGNKEQLSQTFSGLFWLNTLTTALALVALAVGTLCIDKLWTHWHLMLIGALKLVMNYMLIEWLYRGLEEFRYITVRTVLVKMVYVVAVFLFVRQADDYPVYYFLSVMMIVINSLVNLAYSRHYVSLRCRHVDMFRYVKPYFILGLYTLLTSMYIFVNVSWLGFVCGEQEVGYYTTASRLYDILIALFSGLTGVMLPRMSSLLAEGRMDEFKAKLAKANNVLFAFAIPLVLFTVVNAPSIIYIVAGEGYEGAVLPMRIMMPLILIIGYEQILVIQTLMPLKQDKAVLRNSMAGAATGLLLNILLISRYAAAGASLVWVASEVVVLCCSQYYVVRSVSVYFPWRDFLSHVLACIPLAVGLLLCHVWLGGLVSFAVSCLFAAVYFVVCNLYIKRNEEFVSAIRSLQSLRKHF